MISKERLNELALEVATETYGPVDYAEYPELAMARQDFAHALIKRIEQEAEVVGWGFEDDEDDNFKTFRQEPPKQEQIDYLAKWNRPTWQPLIALPLVEGD